jgi:hypothetical protein
MAAKHVVLRTHRFDLHFSSNWPHNEVLPRHKSRGAGVFLLQLNSRATNALYDIFPLRERKLS